jgi:hypothetical protein
MTYIEKAEEMIIERAKEMNDMLSVIDALSNACGRMFHQPDQIDDVTTAIKTLRRCFYTKYSQAILDCFGMVGVGGEKAKEYSKERFMKLYGESDRYSIMHLLDKYGNVPDSYKMKDEDAFRKEIKKKLHKGKKS